MTNATFDHDYDEGYLPEKMRPAVTEYAKGYDAKATVGETMQVAQQAVIPAFIAARFALMVAGLALVVSAVALAVAFAR